MPEAEEHVETPAMALTFTVRRREPELVGPASLTPRETKRLSDIDDQDTLRGQALVMFFYRGGLRADDDPAGVIRGALGEALVPYYPLAGRLREVAGRKLLVDCTSEGVMFAEADAGVRLAELEAGGPTPPFPYADQLLLDVQGSSGVLDRPLLHIQVTRLLCGGFVLALRLNHTVSDAIGIVQFLSAVAELARGLPAPTVAPPWSRELLEARNPPRPSFLHHQYDAAPLPPPPPPGDMVTRTFTFGPSDVNAIKKGQPPSLRDTAKTFEVLTAALWRARTAALELLPDDDVRLLFICNVRGLPELGLPAGYYGNAAVSAAVLVTVGVLLAGSLGDTVELVRQAKAMVTAEYVRSTADLLVLRGRPRVAMSNMFAVSDNRRTGFHTVDFGWGVPVFAGPSAVRFGGVFILAVRNGDGEKAVAFPVMLPRAAMDRFASEVERLIKGPCTAKL